MKSIEVSADNLLLNYPESVHIKRNADGTYNIYTLMRLPYNQNGDKCNTLLSLRSEQLLWNRDFNMDIELSTESEYIQAFNGRGAALSSIPTKISREILYNLRFSKSAGALVDLMVMNYKEGQMNYNIYEGLENYTIQVNVAGFTSDELSIAVEGGLITVTATPEQETNPIGEKCLVNDFTKSKSKCEIYLPNTEHVSAELKGGVLTLIAPKAIKGERVEIKVA